jgi:Protein of unknown function (DUF4065)
MAFNREKFKQLVHYVIWRAGQRDWFGAVKLNKVLWFSDTETFAHLGEPITGATYTRQQFGPVPKAIMPIRSELVREGKIEISREGRLERLTALTKPDMQSFTSLEMAIIDWWIEHIATYETAQTISAKSHDYAWQIASLGETLPMTASLAIRLRPPNADEMDWAKRTAAELGLI